MSPEKLAKEFIKNTFIDTSEGNIKKLIECYDYFNEHLPIDSKNSEILHQLLEVIEMLEIIFIRELNNGL